MKLLICHDPKLGELEYDEERFERIFGIKYITGLQFANWEVEQLVKKQCAKVANRNRIGQNAKWLGTLYSKFIQYPPDPNITIRWINEKIGYGVFTNVDISPWQYFAEYAGILRRRKIIYPDLNDYCFMYPDIGLRLKALTIDSKDHGNYTRFINHSSKPNLESISVFHNGVYHIIFRSIRHIKAGSELTYDYGDYYWRRRQDKII